jgi:translocation and assembly module TamB
MKYVRILLGTLAALAALGLAVLNSPWLQSRLERQVVEALRRQTGARVEMQRFAFDWRRLRLEAGPLTLRGTESDAQAPLFRAERVAVGFRIDPRAGALVRIASLEADRPVAAVFVAADGSSNIPRLAGDQPLPETLVDLELSRLEIRAGELRWNERRIPIDLRASGVAARAEFDSAAREYQGFAAAERIDGAALPLSARLDFALSAARLNVRSATIRTPLSEAAASGEVANWRQPAGVFETRLTADLRELAQAAGVRELRRGKASGAITIRFAEGAPWRAEGVLRGEDIDAEIAGERIQKASLETRVLAQPASVRFEGLRLRALGGEFSGAAEFPAWRRFSIEGELRGVAAPGPLAARVSGTVSARGRLDALVEGAANLRLEAAAGDVPVAGTLEAAYRNGNILVRRSALTFGESHLQLSGELRGGLAIRLRSSDLGELVPALRLLADDIPEQLPVSLDGQPAELIGTLHGSTDDPQFSGRLTAARLRIAGQTFSRVSASGDVSADSLSVRRGAADYQGARVAFTARVGLDRWRPAEDSRVEAAGDFEGFDLAAAAQLPDIHLAVSGTARGSVAVKGTVARPSISGEIQAARGAIAGEAFDRASGKFAAEPGGVAVPEVEVVRAAGRISGAGSWTPAAARFSVTARDWDVSHRVPIDERVAGSGRAEGALALVDGRWQPSELTAAFEFRAAASGSVRVTADARDNMLHLAAKGDILGAAFASDSQWKLEPGLPGGGTLRLTSAITEAAIARAARAPAGFELPFLAHVEGEATFRGRLLEPDRLAAQVRLPVVRIAPRPAGLRPGVTAADLTLRNTAPVLLAAGAGGVVIQQAKFSAKDTELEAAGNVALRRADQMNLLLRGQVSLAVLDAFNPDIAAAGMSTLNLRIRGPLRVPRLAGRLAFENAAFNLRGFPNGLENVTGAVIFDRTRASVDGLRGQSGGGDVLLNGYVGFGAELSYQLQMALNKVRVRYPEGVSTQVNASLTLTGTAKRSLLAGSVTVLRAGLSSTGDVGGLLAAAPRPGALEEVGPDFRRGVQLDLRVETAQSAQFSTDLTKNVEADIDVRVRGAALRPVVLGRVSVTQGTVQFFGTDYTINRGEVNFVNPVSIEPQVDLDLETRVRGIVVSISFTGPLNRLSMTYRSDPPMQSSEILALLAVGRTPTAATSPGFSSVRGSDLLTAGGTAVLNSALSQGASANNNLQRFFGVTRLKIDPQLIGLDNTPQSRISFEQPISRDVTVTYSQTLARAQGQLVRVQWDLNRQWSALLTRDENGIVSVDFVFRRSFR